MKRVDALCDIVDADGAADRTELALACDVSSKNAVVGQPSQRCDEPTCRCSQLDSALRSGQTRAVIEPPGADERIGTDPGCSMWL